MLEIVLSSGIILAVFGLLIAMNWLVCRIKARRCPCCSSKWGTELWGEWDGVEDWKCHRCGHAWGERY